MSLLRAIREAYTRYRFNQQFKDYDRQIAEYRKQHKRGVLDATAAKRKAVNMALAGSRTRVRV